MTTRNSLALVSILVATALTSECMRTPSEAASVPNQATATPETITRPETPDRPSSPASQDAVRIELPPQDVEVLQEGRGSALLHIDMRGHRRLRVTARYSGPCSGWSLNLGDSITNNGWGGDSSTNFNDAEIQILDGRFEIYGSDLLGSAPPYDGGKRFLQGWPSGLEQGGTVSITAADGEVSLTDASGESHDFAHRALFALAGQDDSEGGVNYDLYLGINRVVAGGRGGSGVDMVQVEFLD